MSPLKTHLQFICVSDGTWLSLDVVVINTTAQNRNKRLTRGKLSSRVLSESAGYMNQHRHPSQYNTLCFFHPVFGISSRKKKCLRWCLADVG